MKRKLTDEQRGDLAMTLHRRLANNENNRRWFLADNAEILNEIKDKQLYKDILGDKSSTFTAYLAQVEVLYSRNQVYSLMECQRKLSKLGVDKNIWAGLPITRLMDALPVITADNVDEWLSKVEVLTPRDFMIEIRKAKGKTTEEDEHVCEDENYKICKHCGKKHKI